MKTVRKNPLLLTVVTLIAVFFMGAAMVLSSVSFSSSNGQAYAAASSSSSHSSSSSSSSSSSGGGGGGSSAPIVLAWNDLGMHCACPTFEGFLLLPPFNTLRAQVIVNGGAQSGYTVTYAMVENTDANLQADPYFASWITNSPKIFPGFQPVVGGKVMSISGKGLAGTMDYNATLLDWKAEGVPAYPALKIGRAHV